MKHLLILAGVLLIACSDAQRSEMEAEKLESFNLTSAQREIADALVIGYKTDTGLPILRSRDYARAACYAKEVRMPARFKRAHILYLSSYPEADKNFYPFFKRHGVSDQVAYDMSQIFQKAYDQCSFSALLKKARKKKN